MGKGLKAVFDGAYNKELPFTCRIRVQGENRLMKAVNELSKVVEKKRYHSFHDGVQGASFKYHAV